MLPSTVVVLTVSLVNGEHRDVEVQFESLEEALKAVENGHAPFSREWTAATDGLVRTSSIVAVDLAKRGGDDDDDDVEIDVVIVEPVTRSGMNEAGTSPT
jgi:hypothetical protein